MDRGHRRRRQAGAADRARTARHPRLVGAAGRGRLVLLELADRVRRPRPRRVRASVVNRALGEYKVPRTDNPLGINVAQALLQWGTEDQRRRFLPEIAHQRETWVQLFSEPGAGSDLAGLATRAVRDGDTWIINGQKVWSSHAERSQWGILLARTDPDVPKHHGISVFLLDMSQPGIDVRPLRQMTGESFFNEVFLDDVECPDRQRLGGIGEGWSIASQLLTFERGAGGGSGSSKPSMGIGRSVDALCTPLPPVVDPMLRARLAQAYIRDRVGQLDPAAGRRPAEGRPRRQPRPRSSSSSSAVRRRRHSKRSRSTWKASTASPPIPTTVGLPRPSTDSSARARPPSPVEAPRSSATSSARRCSDCREIRPSTSECRGETSCVREARMIEPDAEPRTALDMFDRRVAADPESVFVVTPDGGERTYSEIDAAVDRLAGVLGEAGVVPGSAVLLHLWNDPAWVVATLACWRLGAAMVACGGQSPGVEAARRAERLGASVAVTADDLEPLGGLTSVVVDREGGSILDRDLGSAAGRAGADRSRGGVLHVGNHRRAQAGTALPRSGRGGTTHHGRGLLPIGRLPPTRRHHLDRTRVSFNPFGHRATLGRVVFRMYVGRPVLLVRKFDVATMQILAGRLRVRHPPAHAGDDPCAGVHRARRCARIVAVRHLGHRPTADRDP